MKENIHPNYHEVDVVCACGETFKTKSTVNGNTIRVEICNKCHPFYTGKRKMVDSSGRVDKFKKKSQDNKTYLYSDEELKLYQQFINIINSQKLHYLNLTIVDK
mgnify:CR=1 FL=1